MKFQSFLPYDTSTLANYTTWAQGVGAGLAALGWTKTADTGQVIWGNVAIVPGIPPVANNLPPVAPWVSTNFYSGIVPGSIGSFSMVTNGGLTYACIASPNISLSQALQNSTVTLGTCTGCAASSGQASVYTVASGVLGSMVGQQFVVSGMAVSNNNGTFFCSATSGTTSITLSNPNATTSSAQTGTIASSASVLSFFFFASQPTAQGNAYVGQTFTNSAFLNGANNISYTVTSSHLNGMACTATGVNEVHGGVANCTVAPGSDAIHWVPYNFEIWKSTDALSATLPLYLRLVYFSGGSVGSNTPAINWQAATGSTGTGALTGNQFLPAVAQQDFLSSNTATGIVGQGNATFESDFCVHTSGGSLTMCLWRGINRLGGNANLIPLCIVIDRAKDSFGNELDTYVQCLCYTNGNSQVYSQILFKPGINTTLPVTAALASGWPSIYVPSITTSMQLNGQAPAMPIFPLPGYVANPCLGAITMCAPDAVAGMLVNVFLYGAAHTYLIFHTTNSVMASTNSANNNIGLRFE